MRYKIENNKVLGSSNVQLDESYTYIEFNADQIADISKGASVSFADGVWSVVEGPEFENAEIVEKAKRILEIEKELRLLGEVETTSTFLATVNSTRISQLRAEKSQLEVELDEESKEVNQSFFDDCISAIFS